MAHGDTVTNGDGREYDRISACFQDAGLDGFGDFVKIHVTGNDFIIGGHNTDQRAVHVFFSHTQCIEERAVRCAFNAALDLIRLHREASFLYG